MRKIAIHLFGTCLLLILTVSLLGGCAPAQKTTPTMITPATLGVLKGTWWGWTAFSSAKGNPVLTTLEIKNDTLPLRGKVTLINLPSGAVSHIPAESAGNQIFIEFENARITDQGTLIASSGENFLELTYREGQKPAFDGWFYYFGARGTMELTKK